MPRDVPAIGAIVTAPGYGTPEQHRGKMLTVLHPDPHATGLTDTLVESDDGYRCWYAARVLVTLPAIAIVPRWHICYANADPAGPHWATTDRGWLHVGLTGDVIAGGTDEEWGPTFGHYLSYAGTSEPGQDGKTVHAVRYNIRGQLAINGYLWNWQAVGHESRWFATALEARRWIAEKLDAANVEAR